MKCIYFLGCVAPRCRESVGCCNVRFSLEVEDKVFRVPPIHDEKKRYKTVCWSSTCASYTRVRKEG
jgi:hypothetical protein